MFASLSLWCTFPFCVAFQDCSWNLACAWSFLLIPFDLQSCFRSAVSQSMPSFATTKAFAHHQSFKANLAKAYCKLCRYAKNLCVCKPRLLVFRTLMKHQKNTTNYNKLYTRPSFLQLIIDAIKNGKTKKCKWLRTTQERRTCQRCK